MIARFSSLTAMLAKFPDEQSCIDHLTSIRWRNGAYCPYCGSVKVYTYAASAHTLLLGAVQEAE